MRAKPQTKTKFLWCPVCMVHTYHNRAGGQWACSNEDHPIFLRLRDDPWIEEYRENKAASISQANILAERLAKYPV